jgi:putative ATPase
VLAQQAPKVRFDWIIGRNTLSDTQDKAAHIQQMVAALTENGHIVLAERFPKQSQRLSEWLPASLDTVGWRAAEAQLYDSQKGDPLLNLDHTDWVQLFVAAGLQANIESEVLSQNLYISSQLLERWFTPNASPPSYGDYLCQHLSQTAIEQVRSLMTTHLLHQTVFWRSAILYIVAH